MTNPLVVVPTYNEKENIGRLLPVLLGLPSNFHVLVVDDGSPDGTADIIKKHTELNSRVFLLEREEKKGLGTAYLFGFQWALDHGYSHIAQMDADFSHDPNDLERLLAETETADLVLGSRYIPEGGVKGWAKRREFLSRGANLYARLFTRVPAHDLTGGFKCYRREALESLDFSKIGSLGYAFQIETTTNVFRKGFRIREIPIVFHERTCGVSKLSGHVVWEAIWVVLRLGWLR